MDKLGCPFCNKNIDAKLDTCPKCEKQLPDGWQAPARKKFWKEASQGFVIIAVIVAIPVLIWGNPFGGKSDDCGTSAEAKYWAQQFVKARLKSPSSASFASSWNSTATRAACGEWHVRSYVDSQNSFGAVIRTKFVAIVTRETDGQWSLVRVGAAP